MIASFHKPPTLAQVEAWANDRDYTVLQTHVPVPDEVWSMLNETFFSRRPDVLLRVYEGANDLSFAPLMTNVERFAADCLMDVSGLDRLAEMPRLVDLSVGVFGMEGFDFLENLPQPLTRLVLEGTFSKKPNLHPISRFQRLRTLYIDGHQNGVESISELPHLEDLTLRSVTVPSLDFLRPLRRLWSLDIKLGGTRNLDALSGMPSIKYLELWQIQKVEDLSSISEMTGLQNLFLQSLPHIRRLPNLSRATALRRIVLNGMKGLESVAEVATAPNLEDFAQIACREFDPEVYRPLLEHSSLRRMLVSGNSRTKRTLEERIREHDIRPIEQLCDEEAFVYR